MGPDSVAVALYAERALAGRLMIKEGMSPNPEDKVLSGRPRQWLESSSYSLEESGRGSLCLWCLRLRPNCYPRGRQAMTFLHRVWRNFEAV